MGVLEQIVERKRGEVAQARKRISDEMMAQLAVTGSPVNGFAQGLRAIEGPAIIAEIKRASPSKGVLRPNDKPGDWDPVALAKAYAAAGAGALSVLTDIHSFWGDPGLVDACKAATGLPILRKDFILEPWQVDESRHLGADALLLMVRCHSRETIHACYDRVRALGMDALVEVHEPEELEIALELEGAVIGVNHRNLSTLVLDDNRALELRSSIPQDCLAVAESGISSPERLKLLWDGGYPAFLIGGHIASASHPEAELKRLIAGAHE